MMNIGSKILNRVCSIVYQGRISLARFCMPKINNIPEAQLSLIYPFPKTGQQAEIADVDALMELSLDVARDARRIDLNDISDRMHRGTKWPDIYPGEHYKLLAALVRKVEPNTVIEVGTFLGLSSLAMKKYIPQGGRVVTFDILPWESFKDTCFDKADFDDGGLVQVLGDLAQSDIFESHRELLSRANIIFLDGPKNRSFEHAFIKQLLTVRFVQPCLLVIDDIRLWNMLDIWNEIEAPKLDITSFGHFSGTGFVLLKNS